VNLATTRNVPTSFETDNLFIRRYTPVDESILFEAARESCEHVYPFLPWCHPCYTIEEARDWLGAIETDWNNDSVYAFAIMNRDSGEFLGGCGISRIDEHPVVNLGYWIRRSAIGKGVATQATIGLAQFAFEHLRILRVELVMSTRNVASRKVAEKSGAVYEAELKNRLFLHGEPHNAYLYSLTPAS
jgi:RimJ/RimL family protein N-acetyltransferase